MSGPGDAPTPTASPDGEASGSAKSRIVPGTDFGVYHIRQRIGEGGYGEVFLAVHRILRRRAALKVIHADLAGAPSLVDLFLREARLVARFDHPNIVSVYDAGRADDGHLFMAMRFVPGGSLCDLIRRDGALPEARALRILRDCCAGLAAVHGLGLIHRDIKPANILLETSGRACLTDLGLACFHRERIPGVDDEGSVGGTLHYLAPEQLDGSETASPRADLYALGITFTAVLTGDVPLSGVTVGEAMRRVLDGELPDPQVLRPGMRDDLAALLREMTARDPGRRPPDVKAVLARVEEIRRRVEGRKPYAAPAARRDTAQVTAAGERLRSDPLVKAVLDAYPEPAMLLDGRRQIVAANEGAAAVLATGDARSLLGRRPGEALGCAGPRHGPDGCGTGPGCAYCGLGQMLSEIQQGRATPVQGECRIRRSDGHAGAVEYAFKLTTLAPRGEEAGDGPYLLATFRDMSAENRRRVIERSLVENLLDAASVVRSVAHSSGRWPTVEASAPPGDVTELLTDASRTLADEALFHQHLLAAEAGELQPVWETVDVRAMLIEISRILRHHPAGAGRRLVIRAPKGLVVRTDRVLLQRAVRGLVRNALEACAPGEVVTVETGPGTSEGVEIRVHNPGVMPPAVREQVFRRCFSTKAVEGRGIGLHAARLFVETYLGGRIGFASEAPMGTRFWIRVPSRESSSTVVAGRAGA